MNDNNKKLTMEIQADVFQALIKHLQNKTEVQNIDLMNLADFCRNCLSKWYVTAAKERGMEISYEEARDLVYGMPYRQWKEKYQKEATKEQLEKFNSRKE
ncbi:MAG: deoxycytidine triphosphate deaminase [Gammaproteobacteria bacterium]|nr:deoxycytidine triphosphate deaminase [Gammaproteobacteria bacterium]